MTGRRLEANVMKSGKKCWAENGSVLIGEVSMVNDDANDNRFYGKVGRFLEIEEDELPLYLLCNEYPSANYG